MTTITTPRLNLQIELSDNAVECLRAVGHQAIAIDRDVTELRNGYVSPDGLREKCLRGAEGDDVIAGWNEYADAVIAAAELRTIKVDEENNAEEFWDAVGSHGGGSFATPIDMLLRDGSITVGKEEAAQLLSHFRTLPGWSDGPTHAPHPVVIQD